MAGTSAGAPVDVAEAVQQLEAVKRQVEAVRAADRRLLESLAGAGSTASGEALSQQVTAALAAADAALADGLARCGKLSSLLDAVRAGQPVKLGSDSDPALAAALKKSAALGRLQEAALQMAERRGMTAASAPMQPPVELDRVADLKAIQQLVDRVALISGKRVTVRRQAAEGSALDQCRPTASSVEEAPISPGDALQVLLEVEGVLVFTVALGLPAALEPLRMAAFAAEEAALGRADAWNASDHIVHKRLSAVATRAMHFFAERARLAAAAMHSDAAATAGTSAVMQEPEEPLEAAETAVGMRMCLAAGLEDLLLWLASYEDLFSRKCKVSQTLLAMDPAGGGMLPPLLRPYRRSRADLLTAARPGAARTAYHLQAAPLEEL